MSGNQNISGSAYKQTKGREPEKEREPVQLSSTAADIMSGCCPCAACATRRKLFATCLHATAAVTSLLPRPGLRMRLQKRIQEQVGSDQENAAEGPYPSTATAGAAAPNAPPADLGQQDLSKRGADDALAGPDDL